MRLIARAEQCSNGLAHKLEKRGHDAALISQVISRLIEKNLINDRRFAQFWFQSRLRLARSPRRLFASICRRGIDKDNAETALKAVLDEDTEFTMLMRFAKRYVKKAGSQEENNTRQLKHLLKSEGFSATAIEKFLEQLTF